MPNLFKKIFAVALASAGSFSFAESALDFGIDISAERAHQVFESDSANVSTIDIAPHLQYGNWEFSLDAPWISADANYVNSQYPANIVAACSDPAAVYSKHPYYWRTRYGSEAAAIAYITSLCQQNNVLSEDDRTSGMSDITAFAHYGMLLDDEGIWLLSAGLGYKFDNGDAEKNLGSDTRNTLFELGLGANYGKLSASLTGGYVLVDGDDDLTESSYNYASFDIGVSPARWITIGCALDYNQSYYIGTDDVTKTTAYVKLKPFKHVRLKIYGSDFGGAEGYPDREYGGSVSFVY